jgi:CTP:molybdopterin cytidylyltransferase MocA
VREPRPADLLRALLDAHSTSGTTAVTAPAFQGTAGRPVVLGRDALAHARNVRGTGDALAVVLADREMQRVPASDIALLRIDSLADIEAARRALTGS